MSKKSVLKLLGWLFVPFIMIFVFWKRLGKVAKGLGAVWAALLLILIVAPDSGEKPLNGKQEAAASTTAAPTTVATATPAVTQTPQPTATPEPAASTAAAGAAEKNLMPAKIVRVIDGDTMKVLLSGKEETVRLLLVDTPETVHPDKPTQPFGPEASAFAKATLNGKDVKIEIDVSERDKYGRLLCYLYVGDRMFNEMLLEKGLARVAYVIPPNVKYVDSFRAIQKKAQLAGLGIWSIENYALEDGFNDKAAPATTKAPTAPAKPAPTAKPAVAAKTPAPTRKPAPAPTPKPPVASSVYYKNCDAVRAAGAAPIHRGDPGYAKHLDRDGDGIGCEQK